MLNQHKSLLWWPLELSASSFATSPYTYTIHPNNKPPVQHDTIALSLSVTIIWNISINIYNNIALSSLIYTKETAMKKAD